MPSIIAVEELRIGMYIHLEGGWLSHPFPLSNFKIAGEDQLVILRRLGLQQVRWSPERSDLPDTGTLDGAAPGTAPQAVSATESAAQAPAPPAAPENLRDVAARRHREALAAQRETQQLCESQFGEAAQAWRSIRGSVGAQPTEARKATEAMCGAMLGKMISSGDIGIRLVNSGQQDRTAAHALNVTVVSLLIGRMLGLPEEDLQDIGVGALLHDIGKLELPERAHHLDPGANPAEVAAWREHVARGVGTGKRMELSDGALTVIAQHHEHADGSGFPLRLGGDRLSIGARIVAIVDRYDNLCNPATRAPALTPHEAVATLFAQGRSIYDSAVLNSFIRMMGVYPAGSLVQLTDDRYAMVVGVNSSRPLKPRVLVHDPGVPRSEALLLNLEQMPDVGIRRSLTLGKLPREALDYLDPRPRVGYYFEALGRHAMVEHEAAAA